MVTLDTPKASLPIHYNDNRKINTRAGSQHKPTAYFTISFIIDP